MGAAPIFAESLFNDLEKDPFDVLVCSLQRPLHLVVKLGVVVHQKLGFQDRILSPLAEAFHLLAGRVDRGKEALVFKTNVRRRDVVLGSRELFFLEKKRLPQRYAGRGANARDLLHRCAKDSGSTPRVSRPQ